MDPRLTAWPTLSLEKQKQLRALHQKKVRLETGRAVIEGVRALESALAAGVVPELVVVAPDVALQPRAAALSAALAAAGAPVTTLAAPLMAKVTCTETPPGLLGVIPNPATSVEQATAGQIPFILAVDRVQDPGNLGTIIRTAAAAGVTGVLLGQGCVELANPKVLRATAGELFHVPVAVEVALGDVLVQLAARGIAVAVGDVRATQDFWSTTLRPPVALLVGSEAEGPAPELVALSSRKVRIPMAGGVESLNVAVATALLLYETVRQRTPR